MQNKALDLSQDEKKNPGKSPLFAHWLDNAQGILVTTKLRCRQVKQTCLPQCLPQCVLPHSYSLLSADLQ